MDLNLRGKNVLITGSTQGIGRRIANLFAEEGANVAICSRSPESVNKAIKEIMVKLLVHHVTLKIKKNMNHG
jgi:3-oxoacyl-[acyl-carrier protein] reductase